MSNLKGYEYGPFDTWKWKDYEGVKMVNVNDFVANHLQDYYYFIGTDSQNYSKKQICVFTTVLIAYKLHKGGSVIIHKDKVPFMKNLRQRLLMEAMRSLEAAWYLVKVIPDKNVIRIHLDVNQNLKFESGKYKDELIGLVVSQGFECLVKPDAFAASKVADKKC